MKLRTIGLTIAMGTVCIVLAFLLVPRDKESSLEHSKEMLAKANAIAEKDDPHAQAQWEFMRLHSPSLHEIPKGIRGRELEFASTLPVKDRSLGSSLAKGQANTWTKRGPRNVGGRTRAFGIDVSSPNTLLAGGVSGGMYRSTDDGVTWVKTSDPSHLHSVTTLAQDTKAGQTSTWYYGSGEYISNSADGNGSNAFLSGDGLYKSTDNGASWAPLSATATGVPQAFDSFFDYVWKIAVDTSTTPSTVYAATYGKIIRSTDGGTSWTDVRSSSSPYASRTDVVVTDSGVVYAAMSSGSSVSGIWRSATGAPGSFVNITPAGFPTSYARPVLAVAPSNSNVVYLLLQGTNGTEGVNQINSHQIWQYTYITGDGSGANGSWINKGASLPNEPYNPPYKTTAVFDSQGGYDLFVAVKPDNENFVIIGGVNLYKTADFSVTTPTWVRMGGYAAANTFALYANHHPDQHSFAFRPGNSSIFYTGHDGGITKTSDVTAGTVAWSVLNNDYLTSQFYTVAIDHATSGNNEIIGGTQDNGTWWTNSSSASVNWVSEFSGDGAYSAIADGRTSYYASSQNGNTFRLLLDGSGNWTDYANVTPSGASGFQFINPFVLDPNNTAMMYMAAGATVWRNSDLTGIQTFLSVGSPTADNPTSTNWTQMTNTSVDGNAVVTLAVSKSPSDRLYYATYLYTGSDVSALYRVDGANSGNPTPTTITGGSFPAAFISCIAVNPTDADEVLVVFSNYEVPSLWHSTDGGTSWTDVGGNLEAGPDGPSCRWAAIVPGASSPYFVGTSIGLYSASTLGTWSQEGPTTIGNVVVDMIDSRSDGTVVVATHGNGVYSANVIVSAPVTQSTVPSSYELSQNFPNPFNPSTTIQYSLPERARVRIQIYDAAGREVAVLRDRDESAGDHEVQWNARDARGNVVSSGVYFYSLNAVGGDGEVKFARTQKMTFVK